ncbi:MAG TPA: histidine kinase [Solirubrobacteraceae bacterium]|nr:histidine kinase [Solirubrobacteraceae bacterium]
MSPVRGRHKIFVGMAAGVGKTYRMLQDGHAEAAAGRDVVGALIETHRRADTIALLGGLVLLPTRSITYRDTTVAELDLAGVLRRAPDLALIDELAHSNAPGLEHSKRHQDIEDVLGAGIDVFSTLNVQHLESLNDRVAELTGVRVRETVPDAVLGTADEIVMIDLTPEALLGRLRAGKVYPAERVPAALNGFFKIENLAALREVALRQIAENVEARRLTTEVVGTREESVARGAPAAVGERLLALVEPRPASQRLVRRAFRSAQRLGADLDLLWVKPPGLAPDPDQERGLRALDQLASVLDAALLVEESDDIVETIARVVAQRGTTYVLMGRPRRARGVGRLRRPLPQRLTDRIAGVDIRIVADRSHRRGEQAS